MASDRNTSNDRAKQAWRVRLAQALKDRGLKAAKVSQDVGYSRQYVQKVIDGDLNPTVDRLQVICDKAGIKFTFLFEETNENVSKSVVDELADLSEDHAQKILRLLASSPKNNV